MPNDIDDQVLDSLVDDQEFESEDGTDEQELSENQESESDSNEKDDGKGNYEKRYKDSQKFISKLTSENKELRSKMDEINGKLSMLAEQQVGIQQSTQQRQKQIDILDHIANDDSLADSIIDEPKKVIATLANAMKHVESRIYQKVADVLNTRDSYYDNSIRHLDPNMREVMEQVNELRKDEQFRDWPEEALMTVAAKMAGRSPNMAGRGGRPQRGGADIRQSDLYKKIYGKQEEIII